MQWSIVYVSACLALGYQSRLVVAVDTQGWSYIHVWAEDYYNGAWVHVDPSDKVWNSPHRYLGSSWDWGPYIGSTVKVYAFRRQPIPRRNIHLQRTTKSEPPLNASNHRGHPAIS